MYSLYSKNFLTKIHIDYIKKEKIDLRRKDMRNSYSV